MGIIDSFTAGQSFLEWSSPGTNSFFLCPVDWERAACVGVRGWGGWEEGDLGSEGMA